MKLLCQRNLGRLCGAVALSPLITTVASAQGVGGTGINISANLQTRYDSNISRVNDTIAQLRGLSQDDVIISPSLSLDYAKPLGRHQVAVVASAGYNFYRRNSRLNSENLSLAGTGRFDANVCDLDFVVGFSRRQSELGNTILAIGNQPEAIDNIATEQNYGVTATCGPKIGLRPTFGISRAIGDNSNIFRQRADVRTTSFDAGIAYNQPSIGDIRLTATKVATRYPNQGLIGARNNYDQRTLGIAYRREIGARWTAAGSIGYSAIDTISGNASRFRGLTYGLSLTATLTPQLQASANIGRNARSGLNNDAAYTIASDYGFDLSYVVSPKITLNGGYSYSTSRYVYDPAIAALVPPDQLLRSDGRHNIQASASYAANRRLNFSLQGGYNKRNAARTGFGYSGYYAGLGASFRF